ncbi:MAG: photosystem II reaction center protein Psb28 [Oculatellaceae cyanobacterium Prado106]|jgi:photosystem II Psb28-2 protein|nr:photosystem II reaction center protein Psb28 [Oculatellaceae cyanobacterium Prado106]
MANIPPSIEFFEGISEDLSDVSLRQNRATGVRSVLMTFNTFKSIERFRSYTNRFVGAMRLTDSEGQIQIEPASVQFVFGGPEGDELQRMECKLEIDRADHWERFLRFMNRYAEANGMMYGEPGAKT